MPQVKKIRHAAASIPGIAEALKERVASGAYASESEVVRETDVISRIRRSSLVRAVRVSKPSRVSRAGGACRGRPFLRGFVLRG